MLVPRATNVMAVTVSFIPIVQPNEPAMSPIIAVRKPMKEMLVINVGQAPHTSTNIISAYYFYFFSFMIIQPTPHLFDICTTGALFPKLA